MPLHDFKCVECGIEVEDLVKWDEYHIDCKFCGGVCKRIYKTFNGIKHDAPEYLKETLEVVDKDGGKHCQEFLKHPTRANYKEWMKGESLRPIEQGETLRRQKRDTSGIRKKVLDKFQKDNAVSVRSKGHA